MSDTYSKIMADNPTYTANQAIFVYHLRQNPHGHKQIYNELDNRRGGMCALGVGMEAFGIIRTWEAYKKENPTAEFFMFGSPSYYDPYEEIAKKLGIPKDHVNEIYRMNDDDYMSFGEIADAFEAYLATDKSVGPRTLLRNAKRTKEQAKFYGTWAKIFEPVTVLVDKRDKLQEELEAAEDELSAVSESVTDELEKQLDVSLSWYDDVSEMAGMSPEEAWDQFGNFDEDD